MSTQTVNFLSPPEDIRSILAPDPDKLFAERARRFEQLAENHSLSDWLRYLSRLTGLQHALAETLADLPLPETSRLRQASEHGMPPLNAASLARPEIWRDSLFSLIDGLLEASPPLAQTRLKTLRHASPQRLEEMAAALLKGQPEHADLPDLPLIAAALQAVWTTWAARLDPALLAPLDTPGLCPCCGSLPVASLVRASTQVNNLRYLHCSLCNTEWNVSRAVCTACGAEKDLGYRQIEGSNGAVRAECCDGCKSYLKILIQEKDAAVDPVADDLATIALDLLVDEAGYSRSGPNLLLLGGAA